MAINNLTDLLTSLTGQLRTSTREQEQKLEEIQTTIASALRQQNPDTIRNRAFTFERSDLYRSENIHSSRLSKIGEISKRAEQSTEPVNSQVYVRNIPVRTTQIAGGLSLAAHGTRATTYGPFVDLNGLDVFIDLVRIQKLLSLYIEGQALPAILFNASFVSAIKLPNPEITKKYTVSPNTVWIHAQIFNPASPVGYYCGLRVTGGIITLSADPKMVNNKLTIAANTTVNCSLNLEQKTGFANDPTSPYGQDPRNAVITLPTLFGFSFVGANKTITSISPSSWEVYGQNYEFNYANNQTAVFNPFLNCLGIQLQCKSAQFSVTESKSPFFFLSGNAPIKTSWWGIAAAQINIAAPPEADGNGLFIIECGKGLSAAWRGLEGGSISLPNPFIIGEPGRVGLTELISIGSGTYQTFEGWQDAVNPFGTSMDWKFLNNTALLYNSLASGDELISGVTDCDVKTDRPLKVSGQAVPVRSKNSTYVIWVNKTKSILSIVDDNMLWDNKLPADKIPKVKPFALAMHNALFTVTPPNSLILFALLSEDLRIMNEGKLYLGFGLYSYLPTLPDPYAGNLGILKTQFDGRNATGAAVIRDSVVWMWLIGLIEWKKVAEANDDVKVSFHFAPLQQPLQIQKDTGSGTDTPGRPTFNQGGMFDNFKRATTDIRGGGNNPGNNFGKNIGGNISKSIGSNISNNIKAAAVVQNPASVVIGNASTNALHDFALLDVSSNANQMGVAFSQQSNLLQRLVANKYDVNITDEANASIYPILVDGLDVVTKGKLAQAFTVPAIAWEPVFNLTPKSINGDPPFGFNYYQTDGIATRIGNLSNNYVPLSPIPLSKYLVDTYESKKDGKTYAIFNLPFGMVSISMLNNTSAQDTKPTIKAVSPSFANFIQGGIQLELTAGTSLGGPAEGNLFEGFTIQLYNINNADGSDANASTLANSPTFIFNNEFFLNPDNLPARPAVPVNRIGLSGYGANMFSNWQNKDALFAQVSQALFNVTTGRTSHEVVQVVSVVYPWGIKVVRTITLFRLANGYVMRFDSGWKAESDGKFDFSWNKPIEVNGKVTGKTPMPNPYEIHPGLVHGLFGVKNIQEIPKSFSQGSAVLQAVTFDADIELENIVEGGSANRVPSKGVLGYVQLAPAGQPLDVNDFKALMAYENNTIGGPVSCIIKVAGTDQRMQLNRVDVNTSVTAANSPAFVAATRGSVVLPKDGSWSLVQHNRGTGEVTPLPEQLSVPLIRFGKWVKNQVVPPGAANELLRLAHPGDLLKAPDISTLNFGFLQNLNSQKVLFLTPSFKEGLQSMLSKTPPLMADSYRLLNSKGIFPNIDDAESAFGSAVQMLTGVNGTNNNPIGEIFKKVPAVSDVGKQVWEIMEVKAKEEAGKLVDQGFKLIKDKANQALNDVIKFDLPNFEYPLVDITGLKIYIEYKAKSKAKSKDYVGKLDFNVDSFASDLADTWKGRMSNMAMVVDLGPMERLMTIKGNFNAQKGKETDFGSNGEDDNFNLPTPEIEFSDAVEPVIQILEILAALSTGDYGAALKKGLKIAMSNSANIWEYKFEATKDIPLVRFPPEKNLYESPQTPLKLEAGLSIGVYFNAALKVTTDPKQLLPTAGAFFKFHGGLQVMCVSVGAGTIYAVGSADLMLAADTSPVISLTMKFGFGAQVGVGLPVIGNVSILFMVGVEIYADSSQKIIVTAFMLFRGHAEILGGLIGVTITIEAKGSIEKAGPGTPTNCKASVTFALDISICFIIDISFSESWEETRQIA